MLQLQIGRPLLLYEHEKVYVNIEIRNHLPTPTKVLALHSSAKNNLPKEESELLQKILASAKISMQEYTVQHIGALPPSLSDWIQQYNPSYLLIFSDEKFALGKNMQLPLYEVLYFRHIKIFRSIPLNKLLHNSEAKKILWAKMKIMFGL
jgi:DNA polymerase III psi subunit